MEWLQANIGTMITAATVLVGVIGWFLRLEYRVKTMEGKAEVFDLHLSDTARHANGKSVEKLERKIDEFRDELVDTRKSLEIKMDEIQRATRDDLRDLFNKVYDQK